MNDFNRYSCQIPLNGFGKKAQEKLFKSRVLIVGMGGLGCSVSQYLTAAGVGTIGICDFDIISLKNLHRQILYDEKDVGKSKVKVAAISLKKQNSQINIVCVTDKITPKNVSKIVEIYDVVVDCTDNFEARFLINDACVILKKPLIYGAIFKFEGQVGVFNVKKKDKFTPNYRDIFPSADDTFIPNCEEGGVMPTIVGIIGSIQATETIKFITGIGKLLASKLFIFDSSNMTSYIMKLPTFTNVKIEKLAEIIPVIEVSKLSKGLKNKRFDLIDVRTKDEHSSFNIGGTNIPLNDFKINIKNLKFDKPLVIYCRSGVRSASAVKQIINVYPKAKVMSLEGGILAWQHRFRVKD